MKNQEERLVFVDYLRVTACFLVMMVHTSENFYTYDPALVNTVVMPSEACRFWIAFWNGGIARTCVPIFIIISAFLLVPMKDDMSIGEFYRHRFKRILPPMIVFMILYSVLPPLWGAFSWEQSLAYLKALPINMPLYSYHLWFMYPLISLYLFIPFISPWLKKASAKEERIFMALFFASTFITFLHKLTPFEYVFGEVWWNEYNALWYFSGYLGYLVMAHYIRFHMDWSRKKRLIVGGLCFVLASAFTAWSHYNKGVVGESVYLPIIEYAWSFCTPNGVIASFGLFTMFTCIRQTEAPKIITDISKMSFGMYLMHVFFIFPVTQFFVNGDPSNPLLPIGISIPLATLICFIICYLVTKCLSLLPGSKWFVGA